MLTILEIAPGIYDAWSREADDLFFFSTGSCCLFVARAFAVKRVHNHSFVGRIGPFPTSMTVDCKSSHAAHRMLVRTAGAVTREGHRPTKTKGDNSLIAATGILPKP